MALHPAKEREKASEIAGGIRDKAAHISVGTIIFKIPPIMEARGQTAAADRREAEC